MTKETLIEMCNKRADKLDNDVNTGRRTAKEVTDMFGGYLLAMKDISNEKSNIVTNDELASIYVDRATRFTEAETKRAETMLREEAFDRVTYDAYGNVIKREMAEEA